MTTPLHAPDRRALIAGGASALALALTGGPALSQSAPFRIGALNPVTGAGSPYGSGMQKLIQAVNAAGGAGGRPLEVIAEDSQTTPRRPCWRPRS
jgi:branched-chain amino acid transport system substrate-binding protein